MEFEIQKGVPMPLPNQRGLVSWNAKARAMDIGDCVDCPHKTSGTGSYNMPSLALALIVEYGKGAARTQKVVNDRGVTMVRVWRAK